MSELSGETRLAVVGPTPLAEAIEVAGGVPVDETDAADAIVAVGPTAISELAADPPAKPVVPVDAGRGLPSVPGVDATDAIAAFLAGDWSPVTHPLLTVDSSLGTHTALSDTMLVTEQPARISEYAIHSRGERVARFRADGVVVATPVGSHGYARTAGGPVVAPDTGLAVVPISPFATDADDWVLPAKDLELRVERDEAAVELLVDDRRLGSIDTATPVTLATEEELTFVSTEFATGFFE
ncbi:ATP-NAD kinase [Natronomonas sp. EA1]|uniref:ATP-NAD kinase n=1 Tax=Natronomonas sp. EA1 TaxID=3421655 RepID=UPI003EB8D670